MHIYAPKTPLKTHQATQLFLQTLCESTSFAEVQTFTAKANSLRVKGVGLSLHRGDLSLPRLQLLQRELLWRWVKTPYRTPVKTSFQKDSSMVGGLLPKRSYLRFWPTRWSESPTFSSFGSLGKQLALIRRACMPSCRLLAAHPWNDTDRISESQMIHNANWRHSCRVHHHGTHLSEIS